MKTSNFKALLIAAVATGFAYHIDIIFVILGIIFILIYLAVINFNNTEVMTERKDEENVFDKGFNQASFEDIKAKLQPKK